MNPLGSRIDLCKESPDGQHHWVNARDGWVCAKCGEYLKYYAG